MEALCNARLTKKLSWTKEKHIDNNQTTTLGICSGVVVSKNCHYLDWSWNAEKSVIVCLVVEIKAAWYVNHGDGDVMAWD